jgi:hypothetical protein
MSADWHTSFLHLLEPPVHSIVSTRRQLATVRMAAHAVKALPTGDLVETGVFRGGTTVLMARVLRSLSSDRRLWACDSFQGLPRAQAEDLRRGGCGNATIPRRRSCAIGGGGQYSASRAMVEHALRVEGLTKHVRIVPGWFHKSLPPKGLHSIAMLRLDGDTFNGTYEALSRLYPLVVQGGIVYVDDAGSYRGAAVALRKHLGWPIGTRILEEAAGQAAFYEAVWWRKGVKNEMLSFYRI